MSEEFRAVLFTPEVARAQFIKAMAHAKAMLDNGERVVVTVGPMLEPISVRQRRFFHGPVLGQISEQVVVNGTRYVTDAWKEFYRRMFLPDKWVMQRLPGHKRATPKRQQQSTETLGPKGYSELIEKVLAHATTELGVTFRFEADEREGVIYQPKGRKAKDE